MSSLQLKNIEKRYPNGLVAIKNLNLEIKDKSFTVLAGPPESGKSTLLRIIAGIEELTAGEIWMDDRLCNQIPANKRNIAMILKDYVLYPEMTVYDNMAFGLKLSHTPKQEIDKLIQETAKKLDLEDYLELKPEQLCDQLKQRVAIARAVVRKPQIILMDEPLVGLDKNSYLALQEELNDIHNKLQITLIYVTQDKNKVMSLGTHLVLLQNGMIQQQDSPTVVYNKPHNLFVADFMSKMPMHTVESTIKRKKDNIILMYNEEELTLPEEQAQILIQRDYLNKEVIMGIREEENLRKIYLFDTNTQLMITNL